jgi:hypothetical protein
MVLASAAVPEPMTLSLAAMALLAAVFRASAAKAIR